MVSNVGKAAKTFRLLLACWATPSVAWADGGCSGCFDSSGCAWVCVMMLGLVAIPFWLIGLALSLAVEPRLRRALPHLVALGLAYVGAWLALIVIPTGAALVVAPVPSVVWYVLVLKLTALAPFRRRA